MCNMGLPAECVSKGQTNMTYKGELQTLTNLSMRHQVCPRETCRAIISESIITMLMSRGRTEVIMELHIMEVYMIIVVQWK